MWGTVTGAQAVVFLLCSECAHPLIHSLLQGCLFCAHPSTRATVEQGAWAVSDATNFPGKSGIQGKASRKVQCFCVC